MQVHPLNIDLHNDGTRWVGLALETDHERLMLGDMQYLRALLRPDDPEHHVTPSGKLSGQDHWPDLPLLGILAEDVAALGLHTPNAVADWVKAQLEAYLSRK